VEPVGGDLMPDGLDEKVSVNVQIGSIGSDHSDTLRDIAVEHLIESVGVAISEIGHLERSGRVFVYG